MESVLRLKEKQMEPFLGWKERQEKMTANQAKSSEGVKKVQEAPKVQEPKKEEKSSPIRPAVDEYKKEEEHVSIGLYRMGKDEEGNPKIYFDDPDQARDHGLGADGIPEGDQAPEDGSEAGKARESGKDSKRAGNKKPETYKCNTDKVDREIEKLKRKKAELEGKVRTEEDEKKAENLERELSQVERELQQKDNDAYRRQHAKVTKV